MGLLDTSLNSFINTGADSDTVNYAASQISDSVLSKSMSRAGLVQREVTVKSKHGTFTRKQWVKATDAKKSPKPRKVVQPESVHEYGVDGGGGSDGGGHDGHHQHLIQHWYYPVSNCDKQRTAEVYTEDQVRAYYDKHIKGSSHSRSFEHFKQNAYFVSDGKNTTQSFYKRSGKYTPQRQKLHDEIVQEIVDSASVPPDGTKPICFLYGGGSASGKSSVINAVVKPKIADMGMQFGEVDNDIIKTKLPEYQHFIEESSEYAAARVHDEAADITNQAIDALIDGGKNFCYDGTMKNYRKYSDLINRLYDKGYDIVIVAVDIPTEDAEQRALSRAKRSNRHVKLEVLRNIHEGFALTFPKLISEFEDKLSDYQLWDNSQPEGEIPTLIFNSTGISHQGLMERFIKKGEKALLSKQNKNKSHKISRR